jgi:hypothetical protein
MREKSRTCYFCRYWIGEGVRERGPHGECRRYPPVVTARHPDGKFPRTVSTDSCGEWQRMAAAATEEAPAARS